MRIFKKSKYTKILEVIDSLSKEVKSFKNTLCDLEDIKDIEEEVTQKENKLIVILESENKVLRERLHQKDMFIENLLAQLLGGASIKNILSAPKEEISSVSPTMQKYLDKKKTNGGLRLP